MIVSSRAIALRLAAAALTAGCATTRSAPASAAPSDSANYGILKSIADSSEQVKVGAFLRDYQARSVPLMKQANYLGLLHLLDTLPRAYGPSEGIRDMTRQLAGTYLSFIGDERGALASFDRLADSPKATDTSSLSGVTARDAVEAIGHIADTARVIFINEAHHVARDRAFVATLLPMLRAKGFSYLAAETLADDDSSLNARRYPTKESGFYSSEPVFGDMLRTAQRLGFTLVPYEEGAPSQDARELGQARHLQERIFRDHPDARVLVYAGYAHIDESGLLGGAKPMAVRFRELTGIDPVTIDEVTMAPRSEPKYDDTRYLAVVRRFSPTKPTVLMRPDGSFWSAEPGVHDVSVVHPPLSYRDGRPEWLWTTSGRRPHVLREDICRPALECVVSARLASESEDAVPVDVIRIGRPVVSRTLLLPPGEYVVVARDGSGRILSRDALSVSR